jgi:hypothetical protein
MTDLWALCQSEDRCPVTGCSEIRVGNCAAKKQAKAGAAGIKPKYLLTFAKRDIENILRVLRVQSHQFASMRLLLLLCCDDMCV